MTIEFTDSQLKSIASNLGFSEIDSYCVIEDDLRIYGKEENAYAEASLYIDFKTKVIYVTVFFFNGEYLDGEEKKFILNF